MRAHERRADSNLTLLANQSPYHAQDQLDVAVCAQNMSTIYFEARQVSRTDDIFGTDVRQHDPSRPYERQRLLHVLCSLHAHDRSAVEPAQTRIRQDFLSSRPLSVRCHSVQLVLCLTSNSINLTPSLRSVPKLCIGDNPLASKRALSPNATYTSQQRSLSFPYYTDTAHFLKVLS